MRTNTRIFKTIVFTVALIFTVTTIAWSAPDLACRKSCLRQLSMSERGRDGSAIELPKRRGIRNWFRERKCRKLARKAGLEEGTEAFNLAVYAEPTPGVGSGVA